MKPLTLYGVPIPRLKTAIREELELMGFGDEQIRRIIYGHEMEFLISGIQKMIWFEHSSQKLMMERWLLGNLKAKDIPLSRKLGKEVIKGIRESLDGHTKKASPNRTW